MCLEVNVPPPATRDPAQETADTLLAQLEMEKGVGKFAGVGPRIDIERQYRPQYTQLDIDSARNVLAGDKGNNGLIALMAQYGPDLARIEQASLSAQREGDIADVQRLAGASRSAYDQLNPEGAAMLRRINELRMGELENPFAMSASQRREAEQNVRGALASRGLGFGPTDAFTEALYLGDRQRGLFNERIAGAQQAVGLNQSFYGDPFQQILGRPSGSSAQGLVQQAQGFGPQQVFDPYSGYFGEAYAANNNARNAWGIAQGNADAAIRGAVIKGIADMTSATLGAAGAAAAGCWVAREVFGAGNPEWLAFRHWLDTRAPRWLHRLYQRHGERFAAWLADKPRFKFVLRRWMRARIASIPSVELAFVIP